MAQVPDVEIQIANPLKVTLPPADRNFDKIPVKPLEPVYPPLVYSYRALTYSAPSFRPQIRPLRVGEDPTKKNKEGYAALGLGNYRGLLTDLFLPVILNEKKNSTAAFRAFHNSFGSGPVGDQRSASGNTSVFADWRTSSKGVSVQASAGFKNGSARFYGYPENTDLKNDTLRISYSTASLDLKFANNRNSQYQYSGTMGFSQLWNNRDASETAIKLGGIISIKAGKKGEIKFQGDYDLFSREDRSIPASRRHLARGHAFYRIKSQHLQADVGLTGAAENEVLIEKFFHFYPLLRFKWQLAPRMNMEGNLGGNLQKVSLHNLSDVNSWLDRDVTIAHHNERINASTHFNAAFGTGWFATAGLNYAEISNLYFFINQPNDSSRFGIVYDDAKKINPNLSLQFQKGRTAMELKADYFIWNLTNLSAAFHRPEGQVEWNGNFSVSKMLSLRPYALILWGIKAPVASDPGAIIELPAVTDIGFRFDMQFTEQASVQIRLHNMLGTSYSLLRQYPVRGLQGMAVLNWKF